ncbi:unnamed protein product [Closterium sp. Yama58-4]|nr:unnamed protein product [Closterium sp. Yama58-4]
MHLRTALSSFLSSLLALPGRVSSLFRCLICVPRAAQILAARPQAVAAMDAGIEAGIGNATASAALLESSSPLALLKSLAPTLLVAAILAVFIARWFRSGGGKQPPVVPTIPLIGGLLKFMKGPIPLIQDAYAKYGSVFTVNVLHMRMTFLIGPEATTHFYKASEDQLSQREVYKYNVPTFGPGVVFDVDYPIRMEQFRFFADSLKPTRLRTYVDMMVEEAQDFFSQWGDEGEVDLKDAMARLIILTASRCLLGREVREGMADKVSDLFHTLDLGMLPISVLFPYLPIPAHKRRDEARKELAGIFGRIVRARKESGRVENDMLQVFIDSRYKLLNRSTTEEECAGMLIAALFGGQHTSSLTATWVGAYLLTRRDDILSSVVAEQQAVMARHGGTLNYDVLSEMDCLHRVMKEVLRLHPPLVMLLRYAQQPFNVTGHEGKTYTVPKGTVVAAAPAFSNRLPYIYSKPDEFDPDRFAPPREEDRAMPFSFTAFGGGRHGCMGENFAYMQGKTVWSVLLRNFELKLITPFPPVDWDSLVVGPKGPVMVRYKRRTLPPAATPAATPAAATAAA